jgi:predicted permease
MSVRAALGGGRGRLVRQLLTESVVLAVAGGAIGVVLAVAGVRLLLALNPDTLPAMFAVGIDARVLLFCVALSIGTGVLFGLVPAIDAARADLGGSLRDGGRGASGGRHGERVRRTLVIAQIGLAVTLLVGAGLLIESFGALTRVRLGFEPEGVLTAQLNIGGERYASAEAVNRFYDRVLGETARATGVVAVGAAIAAPTLGRATSTIGVEGEPFDAASPPEVGYIIIRGDYFDAMGIPLLAGRAFDATDTPDGPKTVILNEAAARRFFPAGEAVGRRIHLGPDQSGPWITIVGIAGDIRDEALDIEAKPSAYVNHRQETWFRSLSVVVRTSGEPMTAAPALRRAVRDADPTLAVRAVRTLDDVLGSSLAPRRFALGLASCFAVVALLLAAIGIYGVLAYTVTQRTREFGVRLALGATPRGILTGVVRQGLVWSLPGLALGLAGALAGVRLIAGMLYGITPLDPRTWLFVTAGMLLVVCVACLVPAARATRVDPLASMRAE